jgi:hypothetical protein
MTSRHMPFDAGSFDTKIQLGFGDRTPHILNESLRSLVLEDIRDEMLKLWPKQHERLRYLVDRNKSLAASILHVTGKPVFFDASKNPMRIRHLSVEPDVDFRVVHLVRDVRGASLSKRKNQGVTDWNRAVMQWVRTNRNIERQLRRLSTDNWMRIRYEDLCRSPAATLDGFFKFCGLEPYRMPPGFSSLDHHIVGNRMRLSNVGEVYLDEGWRRTLTLDEQACADRLAGSMHVRYGYPSMSVADLVRGSNC